MLDEPKKETHSNANPFERVALLAISPRRCLFSLSLLSASPVRPVPPLTLEFNVAHQLCEIP